MSGVLDRSVKRAVIALLRIAVPLRPARDALHASTRSILVIRQHNQMGDMLCAVPLLRALRAKYGDARIILMTSTVNHEVMAGNRHLNGSILYDKRMFLGKRSVRVSALLRFIKELRARSFDQVVVPATVSTSFTSDLLAFLSGAPDRIGPGRLEGIQNPSGFVYTEKVDLDWRETPHRHQTLRNLDIVKGRGVSTDDLSSEITLNAAEREEGRKYVAKLRKEDGIVVAYHPGAGKIPNRWPAERFSALADHIASVRGASTVITAGPMDDEAVESMVSGLHCPYELIQNRPLRDVASILAEVDLLVSNDTGIMHVGAAVGTPVLSFFGPTDAQQWAPVGDIHRALSAPGGKIEEITLEEAIKTADAMLRKRRMGQ